MSAQPLTLLLYSTDVNGSQAFSQAHRSVLVKHGIPIWNSGCRACRGRGRREDPASCVAALLTARHPCCDSLAGA